MPAPHVSIVGCGFTGTSAFYQIVERYRVGEITIYEATGHFGPGYAYNPNASDDYLINNTNDTMCLIPSNRRAFVNWLKINAQCTLDKSDKGHLPRAVFGRFLEDAFASTRIQAAIKGIKVNLVPAEATGVTELDEGGIEIVAAGVTRRCDAVLLTTGRSPDLDRYQRPAADAGAHYISNYLDQSAFDVIPMDKTIHVLGASLSAYDVVNRLFSAGTGCHFERNDSGELVFTGGPNHRHVKLCSRSGRLKAMQSQASFEAPLHHFTLERLMSEGGAGGLSLAQVGDIIGKEAESQDVLTDWGNILEPYAGCHSSDAINERAKVLLGTAIKAAQKGGSDNFLVNFFSSAGLTLWDAFAHRRLKAADEKLYRRHYETAALAYAAPCPVPTAERLLALIKAGRLTIVAGVKDVTLADDGGHYDITHGFGHERATILINTTGATDRRVTSRRQPALVKSMLANGLIQPYVLEDEEMEGAAVDMQTFRPIGAKQIYMANMLLWGPGFFTSSAYLMASIVERILPVMFESLKDAGTESQPRPYKAKTAAFDAMQS